MFAVLMPSSFRTPAEREAIVARARMELFKLARELDGAIHARLETDIYEWIIAEHERVELFWREPEKGVRLALRNQLLQAISEMGFDMARLGGN